MLIESPAAVLMLMASKLAPYKRITYFLYDICNLAINIWKKASLFHSLALSYTEREREREIEY